MGTGLLAYKTSLLLGYVNFVKNLGGVEGTESRF